MRTINYTKQFKRDYKREKKSGKHKLILDKEILKATHWLVNDKKLPQRYCDHALSGDWKDHRDCHLKPDLILIYRKIGKTMLDLVRLGSHSQLSL